jgi:DNA-binding response OmpR family regulator
MKENTHATLLVVEDVPNIRQLLNITLRFKGYHVITAENGEAALAEIAKVRPALIISDIMMPKMDGFSLVHRLRADEETRRIPIIMISATYVSAEDRAFALQLGAVRFLEKPIDTDEFLSTVKSLLESDAEEMPDPLDDDAFYSGYLSRLENKLTQKDTQITRAQRLVQSLTSDRRNAFQAILEEEIQFRNFIAHELSIIKAREVMTGSQSSPEVEV